MAKAAGAITVDFMKEDVYDRVQELTHGRGANACIDIYDGFIDKIPIGSAINRGLTFRMAQTPVQRYLPQSLERIKKGEIDPSFVITHKVPLEHGPEMYKTFRDSRTAESK